MIRAHPSSTSRVPAGRGVGLIQEVLPVADIICRPDEGSRAPGSGRTNALSRVAFDLTHDRQRFA